MKKVKVLNFMQRRFVSKWIILILDLCIISISLFIVFTLTGKEYFTELTLLKYYKGLISVILFATIGHLIFEPHRGVIRYTSLFDIQRLFFSRTFAVVCNMIYVFLVASNPTLIEYTLPKVILLTNYVLSLFLLILFRLCIKYVFHAGRVNVERQRIMIYGAGDAGRIAHKVLSPTYDIIAFVDDNELKIGKLFEGVKILHAQSNIAKFVTKNNIKQIVISVQNCTPVEKRDIYTRCIDWGLQVKVVPPIEEWIDGELTKSQIKTIRIEDLLGREAIELQDSHLMESLISKTILVTGAAGSIGSEIVRQLLALKPKCLLLLDQAETPMYHLEMEIRQLNKLNSVHVEYIIADVKDNQTLVSVFEKYTINYVFHAAAYKHVPSMENNPLQAIKVNVLGSRNIADLADEFGIEKMVLISTDKAVNPTNIMGASKRAAEIYIQSKNQVSKTAFITTRFGNVLGSNGSVIPLFKKQIEEGGPITVTHPDITRYFMTIPEACQLVLEAGYIGEGGEIFVFDMGESIKINDLAKRMISLSGLVLDKDIRIEYVGLRPGEKLYEELLNANEYVLPTHHKKIMISKVVEFPFAKVDKQIKQLENTLVNSHDEIKSVKLLKQIVPEFISKNSIFEKLDSHVTT